MRDGASRSRTGDLQGAILALYQLSYSPAPGRIRPVSSHEARSPHGDRENSYPVGRIRGATARRSRRAHRPEKSLGTLDEAIREHLELKRRQGAGEDELKQAEAEAFGPGEEDIAPGASITAPAGEGDQLDKVFSGEASDDAPPTTVLTPAEAPAPEAGNPEPEAVVQQVEVEEPEAVVAS